EDFGFLIPSPSQPELDESGNEAFSFLSKLTEPEVKTVKKGGGGIGCIGCGVKTEYSKSGSKGPPPVKVLEEKLVAGFHAAVLEAKSRLLRIYFLGEARYQGELTKEYAWTGKVAWAGKIKAEDRKKVLEQLKLPESTGPAECWLTEFEDAWPYKVAPADVYFAS